MAEEKKATYEDVNLILKLYEMRREDKLREARDWYFMQFFPETIEDVQEVLTPGHPHNAHLRMVTSYWDMAASFAVRGPLNADLLLGSSGELLLVWAKLEKFVPQLREASGLPEFFRNIEEIVNLVDWAPARVQWFHERIAMLRAKIKQGEKS